MFQLCYNWVHLMQQRAECDCAAHNYCSSSGLQDKHIAHVYENKHVVSIMSAVSKTGK